MVKYNKCDPTISVVMPVYNASRYLREAFDSVLSQSYSNIEVVAVDDGSTDGSHYVLEQYAERDPRVKVFQNSKNMGVSVTANKAIKLATGRYIARMDADDVMVAGRLTKQLNFLHNNPGFILVGGQVVLIDEDGNTLSIKNFPTETSSIEKMMYLACPIQQATIMVDSEKLPDDFVWYENGMNTAEEVELMFKLLKYGKLGNIADTVHLYRQHPDSLSHVNPKETFKLTYIARRKGVELYGYKPNAIQIFVVELQRLAISILPKSWIYPIYYRSRKILSSLGNLSLPTFQFSRYFQDATKTN